MFLICVIQFYLNLLAETAISFIALVIPKNNAMFHKKTQKLVELCPQCCRCVDNSSARLVSDTCGHLKCRVCLLQEINGCLKCLTDSEKISLGQPLRKSVITCAEEQNCDNNDKGTCHIIQQTMQKEILFPTEIVKRSTGNFFHLKRIISERFFNETSLKADKGCCTDFDNFDSLPSHIHYYCTYHKLPILGSDSIKEHSSCTADVGVKCSECTRTFVSAQKLQRHMRLHTPSSKFQCSECNKTFKDNYALRTHMRKHTGDRAFACQYCDVRLSQLWSLKRHLAKHRNDRKYGCALCKLKFLTRPELKRHSATHQKGKQFACPSCDATFSFQQSLARHAVIHKTEAISLSCTMCESTFKRKDNLLRHVRNSHSNETD